MQARAIIEAASNSRSRRIEVVPEIMIPLTSTLKEMKNQADIVRRVAEESSPKRRTASNTSSEP